MSQNEKTDAPRGSASEEEIMSPEAAVMADALSAAAMAEGGGKAAGGAEAEALAELAAERDDLKNRLVYALAETENVRKRAERDRRDAQAYGGTRLAQDLLAVHDALEKALENVDDAQREAAGALIEGVELTSSALLHAFQKNGVELVRPEVGERFDPNLHEAMFEAPIPGAETGSIIEVMQPGFTISGRLLRAARVGVARG